MYSYRPELNGGDIREAARATVAAFSKYGLKSCLFGSAACAIYGTLNREPNVRTLPPFSLLQIVIMELNQDVDIVVLSELPVDLEDIKQRIITSDSRFFLRMNRSNTYKDLWFRVSSDKECKVDILIPGRLCIPNIPISKISYIKPFQDIPVVPLMVLLLLKLSGWTDHRHQADVGVIQYVSDKDEFETDEADMKVLLNLAVERYKAHLDDEKWLPELFVLEMRRRVLEYIQQWPDSKEKWKMVGFRV
ncbi:hypothetical protein C0992_006760 [Termitomyces sp. T32_za158]|nr:hypothetical protein C0992_006760 [Termitomyces sp. T32_za158]